MFPLLTRILLWLLIGAIAYTLFQKFPKGSFAGRVVLGIIAVVLVLFFVNPNEPAVASLWKVVSFPLKPLGAAALLLGFAAQKITKDGAIEKPGGAFVGWALGILLLASTPAVAYFIYQTAARAAASTANTLVAFSPEKTTAQISDVGGNILYGTSIASNPLAVQVPSYLLQAPDIRRGFRVEDFVPSARTLQITTELWERYLNQIYGFLRGNRS